MLAHWLGHLQGSSQTKQAMFMYIMIHPSPHDFCMGCRENTLLTNFLLQAIPPKIRLCATIYLIYFCPSVFVTKNRYCHFPFLKI